MIMRDREELYRALWVHTDRNGVLTETQQVLSKECNISYQALSEIFTEWQKMGRLKKFRWQFQLKDPDALDWTSDEYKAARKLAVTSTPQRRTKKRPIRT